MKRIISIILTVMMTIGMLPLMMIPASAASYDAQTVVQLALKKVGSSYKNGYCLAFVADMFESAYGFRSSACCAYKYGSSYLDSTSRNNIPLGASVFFGGSSKTCSTCGNKCGHIGIYVGDDSVVHAWSGKIVKYKIDRIVNAGYPYRGWGWHGNKPLDGGGDHTYDSSNPDDYSVPSRDIYYTSPVMTGKDVAWIQAVLYQLGYSIGIDGSFGPATKSVVKSFQSDNGLTVDGSCGPATRAKLKEKWNNKKNGNISMTLHAWVSNTEYGDTPENCYAQTKTFLCYELVETNTYQGINSFVSKNYTAKLDIYSPDGSLYYSDSINNSDRNRIGVFPPRAGNWKGTVTLSGDISGSVDVTFTVEYNAWLSASSTNVSLNLNGANTTSLEITNGGGFPSSRGVNWSGTNDIVSASFGGWSSDYSKFTMNLTGLKRGSTDLYVNLYENYTGNKEIVATAKIHIEVTANSYTIYYNANGGSGAPSSQSKYYNENLTLSSTKPSRTGYTFLGWSTSSSATSATYSSGGTYTANASATLYAVWKISTYTISYNANGGSGAPSSQTKTYNQTLTLSSTKPTRSGYTFLGWSKSSSATSATYSAGGSFTDNADTVLYAVWNSSPTTYTITYNANGGNGAPSSQIKYKDQILTLSSTKPTRNGYTFLGWSTSSTATSATYSAGGTYTANASATLYAVWKTIPNSNSKIIVTKTNATTGQTVDVPIYIENNPGIVGMTLFVEYDSSALKLTNVKDGGLIGANSHKPEYSSPYTLAWANDTATSNYTNNGIIATLTFEVKNNAAIGNYPITITYDYDSYGIYDKDLNKIAFSIENNNISVTNVICGDVNNDGIVNNLDRVYLTRYLADWSSYQNIDTTAADVNQDGTINNMDRVILTRYLADWSDYKTLPHKQ